MVGRVLFWRFVLEVVLEVVWEVVVLEVVGLEVVKETERCVFVLVQLLDMFAFDVGR